LILTPSNLLIGVVRSKSTEKISRVAARFPSGLAGRGFERTNQAPTLAFEAEKIMHFPQCMWLTRTVAAQPTSLLSIQQAAV
jgi:hypothetical protein